MQLAELFVLHVFSKHGVPSHVTSDRGTEFVSHFFRSLGKALDMRLHFTSRYHPEGDGQTERTNQTLEQYLRIYCNYQQDNWKGLLPLSEFAYNNAPSATTGISPFFANKGYHPNITVHPERDLSSARAKEFAVDLDELHQELRLQIADAQKRYQGPADARRAPAPDFKVGDKVFVKAAHFRTTRPSKKLSEKNLGPFKIIAQVGRASFTLRLPDQLRAVHPVFHVSQLEARDPEHNSQQGSTTPTSDRSRWRHRIRGLRNTRLEDRQATQVSTPVFSPMDWLRRNGPGNGLATRNGVRTRPRTRPRFSQVLPDETRTSDFTLVSQKNDNIHFLYTLYSTLTSTVEFPPSWSLDPLPRRSFSPPTPSSTPPSPTVLASPAPFSVPTTPSSASSIWSATKPTL